MGIDKMTTEVNSEQTLKKKKSLKMHIMNVREQKIIVVL